MPRPVIQFAHPAYRLAERFGLRELGHAHFQTWTKRDTEGRIAEAEVLVISGFWDNALLQAASRLRFIQVCAVGHEQFDLAALKRRGIRLANAVGVNANAVSEHAMAMLLAFTRKLPEARDNQRRSHWRGMISDIESREDELQGKTMLIYGLGAIGVRLAGLARAFGMRTIGIRRELALGSADVDELRAPEAFHSLLPRSDVVVLTCPLNPQTRGLVGRPEFERMRRSAVLINVARGPCVEESALIEALQAGHIAGAGIDVTEREPLRADSPLWGFDNVVLTPHTAGETRRYEDRVVDILLDNLSRLDRGERGMRSEVILKQ